MSEPPPDRPPQPPVNPSLAGAYRAAHYITNGFTLLIGEAHSEFDTWLSRYEYRRYCLLTAHNPRSQPLAAAVNAARHRTLLALLDRLDLSYSAASSHDPGGQWPAEPGVCLFDVAPLRARELGRLYEQHAIVEGHRGGVPSLHWL